MNPPFGIILNVHSRETGSNLPHFSVGISSEFKALSLNLKILQICDILVF